MLSRVCLDSCYEQVHLTKIHLTRLTPLVRGTPAHFQDGTGIHFQDGEEMEFNVKPDPTPGSFQDGQPTHFQDGEDMEFNN